MRADTLADLRCPQAGGPLTLAESVLPVRTCETWYGTELCEGLLHSARSDAYYPIIAGIAILIADPIAYIASQYTRIISEVGPHVSRAMLDYLRGHNLDLFGSESADGWSLLRNNNLILGHYDSTLPGLAAGHPARALHETQQLDWYDGLVELADDHLSSADCALDVGCNVGGVAYRLASRFRRVIGIDVDFNAVLLARSILLQQPVARRSYRRPIEGIIYEQRPLELDPPANVEILLADAFNLPFERQCFDLATTINVLEVVPDPRGLLAAARGALSSGGLLLLAASYSWGSAPSEQWIGGTPGDPAADAMRRTLAKDFAILEERADVPHVVWWNDRMFATYMTHQIVARAAAPLAEPRP